MTNSCETQTLESIFYIFNTSNGEACKAGQAAHRNNANLSTCLSEFDHTSWFKNPLSRRPFSHPVGMYAYVCVCMHVCEISGSLETHVTQCM